MSKPNDPGKIGQYRVVPKFNGQFIVELYGYWDDSVDFPYWGFIKSLKTKSEAEFFITERIRIVEEQKRKEEKAKTARDIFEQNNPPYIFPCESSSSD